MRVRVMVRVRVRVRVRGRGGGTHEGVVGYVEAMRRWDLVASGVDRGEAQLRWPPRLPGW